MMIKSRRVVLAGLAFASALRVSATEIAAVEDAPLRRAAEEAVRTNPYLGVFDHVTVDVDSGRIVLRGSVEQRHRREKAATGIAKLPGVVEVRNEIEVQSSASADVSLRRRLFELVYYGGAIEAGQRAEWPVRILVSDGRVTLAVAAAGGIQPEQLEALARSACAACAPLVAIQAQDQAASARLAAARD
jgi:hypothetical protein